MITKKLEDFGGNNLSIDNSASFAAAKRFFKENGGGTLVLGKGTWYTGPIELCSDMTLEIQSGAVLSFIPEFTRYRPVWTRWEGSRCYGMHPCLFATGERNVAVCGGGTIEGNGGVWWKPCLAKKKSQKEPIDPIELELAALNPDYKDQPSGGGGRRFQFLRPPLVQFYECANVTFSGVTIQNSPFWTFHPVFCNGITVENIKVHNPADAPNTDGMDIDSCSDVTIKSCSISTGDDAIAIKSGSGTDGMNAGKASENIEVIGCTVERAHGGIVIGSETAGGVRNITVRDCVFTGTDRGIRIKTRRGRGGAITDLHFDNVNVKDSLCPIAINMYYRCGADVNDEFLFSTSPKPSNAATPSIKSIYISNIHATGCRASAGFIAALPESKISGLVIKNSTFITEESDSTPPSESEMYAGLPDVTQKSFRILNADSPVFTNVNINGPKEPFLFE